MKKLLGLLVLFLLSGFASAVTPNPGNWTFDTYATSRGNYYDYVPESCTIVGGINFTLASNSSCQGYNYLDKYYMSMNFVVRCDDRFALAKDASGQSDWANIPFMTYWNYTAYPPYEEIQILGPENKGDTETTIVCSTDQKNCNISASNKYYCFYPDRYDNGTADDRDLKMWFGMVRQDYFNDYTQTWLNDTYPRQNITWVFPYDPYKNRVTSNIHYIANNAQDPPVTTTTTTLATTTTTTTIPPTTTTTLVSGSINISVGGDSNSNLVGSNIVIYNSSGSVLYNSTLNSTITFINTSVLTDSFNNRISINMPSMDRFILNNYTFNTIGKSISIQNVNITGTKPSIRQINSNVIASNMSNTVDATLVFNTTVQPNQICGCESWDYGSSQCSGSWLCSTFDSYDSKFTGTSFSVNVSHFSAYIVGSTETLKIWDDTNDPEGLNTNHYADDDVGFFANYSDLTGAPIDSGYCEFIENFDGWSSKVNMTYNASNKLYYIYRSFDNYGLYYFNVTCSDVSYYTLSAVDDFVISSSASSSSDTQWSQVFWFTAESIAHSITYGIYNSSLACSQTSLFYVEPPVIDGFETKINASTDDTGTYKCQNETQGVIIISNDGSVSLNISATFNQITTGVSPKIATSNDGWEDTCSGTCTGAGCDLSATCVELTTDYKQVIFNLTQNTSQEMWLWADFNNVEGTISPTLGNLTTNATTV